MSITIFKIKVTVTFSFVFLIAFLSFFDGTGLLVLSLCAVAVHEAAHIFAVVLLRRRVCQLRLIPFGIEMKLSDEHTIPDLEMVLILISGSAANLLTALLLCDSLYARSINLFLCMFNLLPACQLDGGRLLYIFLLHLTKNERHTFILHRTVSFLTASLLLFLGILLLIKTKYNMSLIITALYLFSTLLFGGKKN